MNTLHGDPPRSHLNTGMSVARLLRGALAIVAVALATLQSVHAQPSYTVSVERLQREIAQRFPLRYPVAQLIDLNIAAPQLQLLPQQNRVNANMVVEATGPLLRRGRSGAFDVDFALRFEASDNTIRAYQLHFQNLQISGLTPQASELLNAYGPALTEQTLQEVVLHQFRREDLTMADALGMQPGSITVTEKGLVIGFVPKP